MSVTQKPLPGADSQHFLAISYPLDWEKTLNKRDQPVLALHAPRSLPLADLFSILLVFRWSGFGCQLEDFRPGQSLISL